MRELFTAPKGTKVTEKMFGRVLLSSVCGILLCGVCLAGATWAWFTVSIDNKQNEIQIASATADITIKDLEDNRNVDPNSEEGGYVLAAGTYNIEINLDNTATGLDDLNRQQNDVYVVMTVIHNLESKSCFFTFPGNAQEVKQQNELRIENGTAAVSFSVSWVKPASVIPAGNKAIVIGELPMESVTETSTEFTALPDSFN